MPTKTKARDRSSGERFIQARGSARYIIKARTKKEAVEKAKALFLADIERGRKSFKKTKLPKRWVGLAGFEAERVRKGKVPVQRELDLEWRNKPKGKWLRGKRG